MSIVTKRGRSAALLAICALVLPAIAAAQWFRYPTPGVPRLPDGTPNLNAPAPKTSGGKPDLSGIWRLEANPSLNPNIPIGPEFEDIGVSLEDGLPYRPRAAEFVKATKANNRANDPLAHCLPSGPVRAHTIPALRQMVQTPGMIVILSEFNAGYRQIFTDGRPLPADPNPAWNGYSTGKWEGDTLVVDTIGFRGMWLDNSGSPLAEGGRMTERFRRVNFGTLEIELTIDDPKTYTEPWTVTLRQDLVVDTELLEGICIESDEYVPRWIGEE